MNFETLEKELSELVDPVTNFELHEVMANQVAQQWLLLQKLKSGRGSTLEELSSPLLEDPGTPP